MTFYGGLGDDVVTLASTEYNNRVLFNPGDGDDTIYGWQKLNGNDFAILGGAAYDTYAIGKNRRDLFVKLRNGLGSIRFVDVLEPVPPFDTLVAVTIDNDLELNAKANPKDKAPTIYDLSKATSLFGATGDLVTIQSDDSAIIIIVSVSAGVGTVVGSGMTSTGVITIDKIKDVTLKTKIRSEILEEDIPTIIRSNGIKIKGNDADNFMIGGTGNDSLCGEDGDDTLEGGAGNDTLTGHLKQLDDEGALIYESDDKNMFVFRAYAPVKPYTGKHVNQTTITDYEEVDTIKIAAGHIESGAISNPTKDKAGTVTFNVENDDDNHNKGTIKVLEGSGRKITVINADGTFSRQVYGASSITIGADDGQSINTMWNPTVEIIDGSKRDTAVGLGGNRKGN